jgi:uncharacterized membrane protein
MEIILYFVAYLIIAIVCAVLYKLCDFDENSATFLAAIWPISVPSVIGATIIDILILKPIEFILKNIK